MHDKIRNDIIDVLSKVVGILRQKDETDISEMKELSNHVIHNASIFQDPDSVSVAVLIYSLSKIIERKERELDYGRVIGMINVAVSMLKNNDDEGFEKSIKKMFDFIRTMDGKLKMYIHEVINQAQIKKGCKLCEHGISVARAAEILEISQWELMHYIGKTTLVDQFSDSVNVSKRLKLARSLFA